MGIIKHGTVPDKRKYFICDYCGCQNQKGVKEHEDH